MKKVDFESLNSDPLASALYENAQDCVVIDAYICSKDEESFTLSMQRESREFLQISRSAVLSVFEEKEGGGALKFAIKADAKVKTITSRAASSLARINSNGSNCSGAECQSGDGSSTCCCLPGQRCSSTYSSCSCENTGNAVGTVGGVFGGATVAGMAPKESPFGTTAMGNSLRQGAELNWSCSTPRGNCPIVCYPVVVNGKVVDIWCYCDCTNPIPYKNSLG